MPDHHRLAGIAVAALVTAVIRAVPVLFLARRTFPVILRNWLAFVPVAILAAIIAAEVIASKTTTSFGFPVAVAAILLAFAAGIVSRSLLVTVIASILGYMLFQNL